MSANASQNDFEKKLHKLASKKNRSIWILDIIAIINAVLLLFDIGFMIFVFVELGRGRFRTYETRLYYGLMCLTLALNIAAIVLYIVFCIKRDFNKIIWYIMVNTVFVVISLCLNVILYTNIQILEALDDDDAKTRHDVNLIFFIMFIVSIVNCIIIVIANIQQNKYRVYTKSFSTTLNSTASLSRSVPGYDENQLKNFIDTEAATLEEKRQLEKQLQEALAKVNSGVNNAINK